MILNVHLDAPYLPEPKAKSRVAEIFFLGDSSQKNKPILLNGNIFIICGILKCVVRSAAEAELGGLFMNGKEARAITTT